MMSYNYEQEKSGLFTDEGQRMFLRVRDRVRRLLSEAEAFTMGAAIRTAGSGSSWQMLACVDRLVELGEIKEITSPGTVAGQNRVFVVAP